MNELIAEYLGFEFTDFGWVDVNKVLPVHVQKDYYDELLFHISWDWIMVAIDSIYMSHPDDSDKIAEALGFLDIDSVYEHVIHILKN